MHTGNEHKHTHNTFSQGGIRAGTLDGRQACMDAYHDGIRTYIQATHSHAYAQPYMTARHAVMQAVGATYNERHT